MPGNDFSKAKETISKIANLFKSCGYPAEVIKTYFPIDFCFEGLKFSFFLPLVIKDFQRVFLVLDYKPAGLASYERGLLALARSYFSPPPALAIVTNGEEAIKIEVGSGKTAKGALKELIPKFEELKNWEIPNISEERLEKERRLLYVYLSGG